MRTHEQKKVLKECEGDEAKEVEHFILDVLSKHDLASINPVASIVGLTNALLTVATRLEVEKESFFDLIRTGWDYYQEQALDEDDNRRVH